MCPTRESTVKKNEKKNPAKPYQIIEFSFWRHKELREEINAQGKDCFVKPGPRQKRPRFILKSWIDSKVIDKSKKTIYLPGRNKKSKYKQSTLPFKPKSERQALSSKSTTKANEPVLKKPATDFSAFM